MVWFISLTDCCGSRGTTSVTARNYFERVTLQSGQEEPNPSWQRSSAPAGGSRHPPLEKNGVRTAGATFLRILSRRRAADQRTSVLLGERTVQSSPVLDEKAHLDAVWVNARHLQAVGRSPGSEAARWSGWSRG